VAGGVAAALFFVLRGDDETRVRTLRANLTTALLVQTPPRVTFGGFVNQTPGGQGLVLGRLTLQGVLKEGKPVPLSSTMTFRFDVGRLDMTLKGTATLTPQKTTDLAGRGTIVGGTGQFDGAKGSFQFKSSQESENPTVGHPRITGTIEY
jgi:hypothetical protein